MISLRMLGFCGLLSAGLLAQLTTATVAPSSPYRAVAPSTVDSQDGHEGHEGHEGHNAGAADDDEDSPLVQAMDALHSNERLMKKALKGEGDIAGALVAVIGMQKGASLAKLQTPPLAEELEASRKAAFLKGFRLQIIGLQRDLLALEEALLNGDLKAAKAQFAKVREREKAGHDRYSE